MAKFVNHTCLAFTWTALGQCRGVLLRRSGDRCRIESHWGENAGKSTSPAETLSSGRRALGAGEMTLCLAGSADSGWAMVDVDMPQLKPAELRSALGFELRKHTPVLPERLAWGYRILPGHSSSGRILARLYYLKSDIWRQWIDVAGGLGQCDALLPPPVALDPLLADQAVYFPGRNVQDHFLFMPVEGRRAIVGVDGHSPSRPQNLAEALPLPHMDWGGLAQLSSEEQLTYVGAVTLGVYGLTREAQKDQKTLLPVPENLRPRRNQGMRVLTLVLLLYICGALLLGSITAVQNRMARLRQIESEKNAVQAQVTVLQKQLNPEMRTYAKTLRQELTDAIAVTPTLPQALLELTRMIEAPTWMSGRFEWKEGGQIDFQIQETESDPELATKLEHSPILGDVRELTSTYDPRENKRTRKFTLNARFDTEKEREEAKQALARRQERARAAELEKENEAIDQENDNDNQQNDDDEQQDEQEQFD